MIDVIKILSHAGLRGLALNVRRVTSTESPERGKSSARHKASAHTKYRRHFGKYEFNDNDHDIT